MQIKPKLAQAHFNDLNLYAVSFYDVVVFGLGAYVAIKVGWGIQ